MVINDGNKWLSYKYKLHLYINGYKSDDTFHKRGDLVLVTAISGEITKDCIFLNGKSLEDHGVFMGESKGETWEDTSGEWLNVHGKPQENHL